MKGLKKIALASAIAAVSAGAQAELKALDDSAMGELTGQAGLTIDLETKYTIGEFQYKDAGSVFFTNIKFGGNENENGENVDYATMSYFDNVRITLDVAGAGAVDAAGNVDNEMSYGFSEVRSLAGLHQAAGNGAAEFANAATGTIDAVGTGLVTAGSTSSGTIDAHKTYGDGDLVIHVGFNDAWQKAGGFDQVLGATGAGVGAGLDDLSWAAAVDSASRAADFNLSIDAIGIASSTFVTGETIAGAGLVTDQAAGVNGDTHAIATNLVTGIDTDTDTTVLISGLDINGYLGPVDISIENNGNGFGADGSNNVINQANGLAGGNADSKINWDTYVKITDLDVYIDIAGVMIEDLSIDNTRGDVDGLDGTFAFGFAHSKRDIYAVQNNVMNSGAIQAFLGGAATTPYGDGVAINTEFKGDMSIGALSFGDTGTSIGELHWTDITRDTRWTISAH